MNSATDNELMRQVREGNVAVLGHLFERYHVPLFNFFLRLTWNRSQSEDLVQDVFFRILRFRATYRDDMAFSTWMYQIARNVRVDALRKQKPESALDDEMHPPADARPSHAEEFETQQNEEFLRQALARLPEDAREVLILSRYQNLKYDQIAEMMNCQTGTIKARVFRAMKDLRQIYFGLASGRLRRAAGEPGIQEA